MKKLSWIIIFVFFSFSSEASQVSGYISLKYLGDNTYQATIIDYTTNNLCDTTNSTGDTLRLYWGDGTSSLLIRSNGLGDSVCDCKIMNMYTGIHSYSNNSSHHLWCDAGPRVANIANMTNSGTQDMIITQTLPFVPQQDTSFPIIVNPPICLYGCKTQCFNFNLGAYVHTGYVTYSLGNCLPGIGYSIPSNVSINSATGELTWCNPDSDGLYNFAITMVTIDEAEFGGGTTALFPADSEEVELQVTITDNCALYVNEMTNADTGYIVSPNPSNGIFTIQSSLRGSAKQSLQIYNVLGKEVFSQLSIVNYPLSIDLTGQPSGVYLYRVIADNGTLIGEGKIIIQK